jgi:hypothetical protein
MRLRSAAPAALLLGLLVLTAVPAPSSALRLFGYTLFESGSRESDSQVSIAARPSNVDVVDTQPESMSVMLAGDSAAAQKPKVGAWLPRGVCV